MCGLQSIADEQSRSLVSDNDQRSMQLLQVLSIWTVKTLLQSGEQLETIFYSYVENKISDGKRSSVIYFGEE